jgi:DNA-binding beta-propeller fold protein YncE
MRLALLLFVSATLAQAQSTEPLKLQAKIELSDVQGRIDHMSIDVQGQRLFVSALGNGTLEVIDLRANKRSNAIRGLQEPQGALYVPENGHIYVASSKDGTVKIFNANSLQLLKTVDYGDDADNLRYGAAQQRVYVGYGSGGLGEMNLEGEKISDIKLDSHPESFQLEKNSPRIYVNLPKSKKIGVLDREKNTILTTWGTGLSFSNYPMALDEANHRLFVVTRVPARLLVLDTTNGRTIQTVSAVGDCDDVFFDQKRKRIYASGGDGAISVFEQHDSDHYKEIARIATVKGARTSFFSPDLDRLYLAARRQGSAPAMVEVFAPAQ